MAGLGMTLGEARRRLQISLEQAERATRVRREFLVAFEEEQFDLLPPRAYAQGLLSVYARYLGLDPEPLVRELPPDPHDAFEPWPPPPPPSRRGRIRAWLLVLGLLVLVLGLAAWWAVAWGGLAGPAAAGG